MKVCLLQRWGSCSLVCALREVEYLNGAFRVSLLIFRRSSAAATSASSSLAIAPRPHPRHGSTDGAQGGSDWHCGSEARHRCSSATRTRALGLGTAARGSLTLASVVLRAAPHPSESTHPVSVGTDAASIAVAAAIGAAALGADPKAVATEKEVAPAAAAAAGKKKAAAKPKRKKVSREGDASDRAAMNDARDDQTSAGSFCSSRPAAA